MRDQDDYTLEISERCTDDNLADAIMLEPLSETEKIAAETAYRRGFFHGMSVAHFATVMGMSEMEMLTFINDKLYEWRMEKHNGSMSSPPAIHFPMRFFTED